MDTPTQWTVPNVGGSYTQTGFNVAATNDGNKQWVTFDIDGDGLVELVQTADPTTGKVWGAGTAAQSWKVYKKDGWGFSQTPIIWPVPDSGHIDGFDSATGGGAGRQWVTLDLDGDGKPDLVQTSIPSANKVWGAGTSSPYWKLYRNLGAGFATTATNFAVPDGGADGFFAITSGSSNRYWTLLDLDGDARLDLVQTADPATGDVWGAAPLQRGGTGKSSTPYWKVFRGLP